MKYSLTCLYSLICRRTNSHAKNKQIYEYSCNTPLFQYSLSIIIHNKVERKNLCQNSNSTFRSAFLPKVEAIKIANDVIVRQLPARSVIIVLRICLRDDTVAEGKPWDEEGEEGEVNQSVINNRWTGITLSAAETRAIVWDSNGCTRYTCRQLIINSSRK